MADSAERLRSYLLLLSRFGLSEDVVKRLHWSGPVPDEASVQAVVAEVIDEDERTPADLYDRAHRLLAASPIGIEVPRDYDEATAEAALDGVLDHYDTTVTIDGVDDDGAADPTTHGPFEVSVTDAAGETRTTTFAYPDRPIGNDNLPALLHEIETELLADTGMTFAVLSERETTWRAVFLNSDRLDALRDEYGDRITVMDEPLLDEAQPADYAEPTAGGDDEILADEGDDAPDWLSGGDAGSAFEEVGFEPASVEEREEEEATETIDDEGIEEAFADMEAEAGEADAAAGSSPDVEDLIGEEVAAGSTEEETAAAETVETEAESPVGAAESAEATDSAPDVTPAEEPVRAVTPIALTPGDAPSTAVREIGVTPSDTPTSAVDEIAVTPAADPEPVVERAVAPPAVAPTTGEPSPAVEPIAVTPGDDPEPAVEPVATVEPGENPQPAVTYLQVTPGTEPTAASSGIAVTPADDPDPAVERRPAVTPTADEAETAVRPADVATAADASPAVAPADDPEPAIREATPEGTAAAESTTEAPAVTPTDGEPIPAVVARGSEADAAGADVGAEVGMTAGGESGREAESASAPAEVDLGSEAPTDGDAAAATADSEVQSVPEREGDRESEPEAEPDVEPEPDRESETEEEPEPEAEPDVEPETETEAATTAESTDDGTASEAEPSRGPVGRFVAWLRGLF